MTAANAEDECAELIKHLKSEFRYRGIRYQDVADTLGVSLKTVKRYMTGKGLKLITLKQLCDAAGINLRDLMGALPPAPRQPASLRQQRFLSKNLVLGLVTYLLVKGWHAHDISSEFGISAPQMNALLTQLDREGIIVLFPGNRARVLVTGILSSDDYRAALWKVWQGVVEHADPHAESLLWELGIAHLSASSVKVVEQKFQDLIREVAALSDQDRALGHDAKWYYLATVLREADFNLIGLH